MKSLVTFALALLLCAFPAASQTAVLKFPKAVQAGATFSVPTTGAGNGVLYIIGPGQVLERNVQLGNPIAFSDGDLHNAGHYTAFLVGASSTEAMDFDVIAAPKPKSISFLAKPSRVPVSLPDGISGVVYLFDEFRNLILNPTQVSFQLSEGQKTSQDRTVTSNNGVAWLKMNSAPKAGLAEFHATAGGIAEKRIVQLVPGDPCTLRIAAHEADDRVDLQTDPVRDCSGNPVPDGTIVTFTEIYNGSEATVDAPLKRDVARAQMPAHPGAVISVASGVVMGNEIRLQAGK